jgi:SAM domain (Sterile alpha motif)
MTKAYVVVCQAFQKCYLHEAHVPLLRQVDDQTLKDIGISIGGHRLRIRNAIANLVSPPVAVAILIAISWIRRGSASGRGPDCCRTYV